MYIDITKPPPPLPVPRRTEIVCTGVSLLQPLSRRGTGPGILLIVPDSKLDNLTIKDGIPSPFIKWAEEGYSVIEIQEHALKAAAAGTAGIPDILQQAQIAFMEAANCAPKERIGLVVYNAKLWMMVAPHLRSRPEIAGVIIYANAVEEAELAQPAIPYLKHLAGKCAIHSGDNGGRTFDYPSAKSSSFALPFQEEHDSFSYSLDALSHTRNLSFLKPLMNGPYFDLESIWDEHTYFEFENRSVEWTMSTMVQEPYVNHIPTMTGGVGREHLTQFYANHFIFENPADAELEVISRSVGIDRVIDEFIYKITHDRKVDWLLPGVPPTGKKLEIPMMAVVNIRGDRLYHEHISWDQGTVLSQLDLLPNYLRFPFSVSGKLPQDGNRFEVRAPVAGIQTAAKMRDRNALESNDMFSYGVREVTDSK